MFSKTHCTVIGEVALAHDGSLGTAHAYIDAIANAGADAIKFQTHIASAESTPAEQWRVRFSPQDKTRMDYWRRTSFTEDQWAGLRSHAIERGLQFLSSPFSLEAAELLTRIGVEAWKVASGEVGNLPMLDFMARTGRPMLISTGMSSLSEIDALVERVCRHGSEFALLQCTSKYPCPAEEVGLDVMQLFHQRYRCPVGLSDHSGSIFPALAAAALGASVIEVHTVFSRECFGPDLSASVTTAELKQLVDGVCFTERMIHGHVEKDRVAAELEPMRRIFSKSVVANRDLAAGTVLLPEHLALKKPGMGLPASTMPQLIGRRLTRDLHTDEMLHESDLAVAS